MHTRHESGDVTGRHVSRRLSGTPRTSGMSGRLGRAGDRSQSSCSLLSLIELEVPGVQPSNRPAHRADRGGHWAGRQLQLARRVAQEAFINNIWHPRPRRPARTQTSVGGVKPAGLRSTQAEALAAGRLALHWQAFVLRFLHAQASQRAAQLGGAPHTSYFMRLEYRAHWRCARYRLRKPSATLGKNQLAGRANLRMEAASSNLQAASYVPVMSGRGHRTYRYLPIVRAARARRCARQAHWQALSPDVSLRGPALALAFLATSRPSWRPASTQVLRWQRAVEEGKKVQEC